MKPIGRVRFQLAGRPQTAILHRDGRWEATDPLTAVNLSILHPLRDVSEADGQSGWRQLREAAQTLGGTAELA